MSADAWFAEPIPNNPHCSRIYDQNRLLVAESVVNEDAATIVREHTALAEIRALMDGAEWSCDTLQNIAHIFERNGMSLGEPAETSEGPY